MNTIIVKVNDATQTISQVDVVTKDGIPTVITATDKVNYEFLDTAINHAPNHIVTKRLNNDLHVSFEEAAQEADLIIEGFYDSEDSALLGIAEDGEYYYYIPDTGETYDYVTQLEAGDVEGQALGGEEYIAAAVLPWWIPAAAGIGLAGLIAGRDSDDDSNNDFNDNAPVAGDDMVTPEYNTPVEKELFDNDSDPDSDPLEVTEFTVDGDTTVYTPDVPATVPGVGTITITPEGKLTFTPNDGYEGAVPDVTYTVTDGNGGSDDAVVSFDEVPAAPNTPPVADNDTVTPEYNTPVEKELFDNDSDPDSDPLEVTEFTVDGDTTVYTPGVPATVPGVGTITITPEGKLTFTPNDGYEGAVPDVTYTVTDGNGGSDDAVVSFDEVPAAPNTPPVADNDTVTPEYNTPVEKELFDNDSDPDSDPLEVTEFTVDGDTTVYTPGVPATVPGVGTITITPEGKLTFTPNDGYEGAVPDVTYTVTDGNGGSDDAVVSFDEVPAAPNTPPVADNDTVTPEYNTPVEKELFDNDSDPDSDPLEVTEFTVDGDTTVYTPGVPATVPSVGTITITPEGKLTFTPNDGYEGAVPDVTYTVTDGNGGSDDAVVSFDEVPAAPNTPPVADNDTVTPEYNTPVEKELFDNDSDPDSDPLEVTEFTVDGDTTVYTPGVPATVPGVGTITITPEGKLTFTPNDGYEGAVPDVTYTVTDGNGGSDDAVVSFDEVPAAPNTPPVADNDTVTPEYNTPVEKELFDNDSDPLEVTEFTVDGDTTVYTPGVPATVPGVGTITITPEGKLTFTPNDGYEGAVPDVTYTVTDGNGGSDDAVVSFDEVPAAPNTPPVADNDTVTPEYNTPVEKELFDNDSDPDSDPLEVTEFTVDGDTTVYTPGVPATVPGVGTITITPEGKLTFTPNDGYEGAVPDVTYTVTDGNGGSDDAVVSFDEVPAAPNTPPVADNDTVTPEYNTPVEKELFDNDSDPDSDPLEVTEFTVDGDTTVYTPGVPATVPGVGTITITPEGKLTFTPNDGYEGAVPDVTYTVTDGNGGSDDAVVSFDEVPAGLATNDIVSTLEDSDTISGNVLDNDKTGLTVTAIQIAGTDYSVGTAIDIPNVGTVQIDADGVYSFTPTLDYSGEVPDITYTVSDGTTTDTANLDIEVTAVADQPTTGSFELDPLSLSLNIQTWSNAKNINGQNLLANAGGGASEEVLIGAIDDLRNDGVTTNDDNTAVTNNGISTTTSLADTDLPEYDAVYISGYVFLEVGETYLYSGSGDDSAAIVIGDNVSSLHVNWRGTTTSGNGEFDVTESGYYSFQFYAHNADNIGNYNFAVQNADGTTEMKYYQNLSAIEGSLAGTSYILGDYDAGVDGSDDTGFYSVSRGYEGASADSIQLTGINLQATDTDGSEYLSFEMSGLPVGAILTFKDALGNEHSVTADANGTASYTPTASDTGTSEYSDFTLNVKDTTASSLDVSLTVTSTETLNNESSSTTLDFEVEVTDASNSDDTILFNADSTSMNGGDGTDTLLIDVNGTSIDFSNFDSSAFESLEVIDMTDNGTQTLTNLTTSDVLEITNETVMTDKGLIINGDSADSVSLSGSDWTNTGTTTQDSNTYDVYSFADTNGTHELLIQTDITTTVL